MSYVYLIRHGQAGTRENYDTLSETGREQARLLGEHLAAQKLEFRASFTGDMRRQNETAREVREAYGRAGLDFPEPAADPGWREFDLDHVYRGMAPHLCAADAAFKSAYEAMVEEIKASQGRAEAEIHRRWSPCDIQVVEAWIRGRFPFEGESFEGFCERVRGAAIPDGDDSNIIVFTSATPTAIWAGRGLDLYDERVLRIAGVLYNTSITVLRMRSGQVRLFSLNGVPHLPAEMRTHR